MYVNNLSEELTAGGEEVFINYIDNFLENNGPPMRTKTYTFGGVPIFVIEKNISCLKTKDLYFDKNRYTQIYEIFKEYIKSIRPDLVNFHHFSPTDVISQIRAAKEMQIPIILTYHTPMMTCGHSDMLYSGTQICDGRLDYKRCLMCGQTQYGIPLPVAYLWANLPVRAAESLGRSISKMNIKNRFATWLQLPWLIQERINRWLEGFQMVDHFVAVCQWVYELLLKNNIPQKQISICRQGVGRLPPIIKRQNNQTLRLGYLGRIHPLKGVDILLNAFKFLPSSYRIELFIYSASQRTTEQKYYNYLRKISCKDNRIKWEAALLGRERFQTLSQLDALVVPSRWLETGPLVLLESWAVGTPVIGAKLGGIAELVKQGDGGLLFKPGDARELSEIIKRIYNEPDMLNKLKLNIPKVRTMKEVSQDMEVLYNRLINRR